MAKAKVAEVVPAGADQFTDRVMAEVEKDFGEGVMISGVDATNDRAQRIPWSPALDVILGGGIEEGSWVGVTGHPKTTKTSSCLTFAANCQRPEYGSRPIYYDKVEGRLSLEVLEGIKGLDLSKGRFNIIQSREGKILSAQDRLRILASIIHTVPKAVIIIDSISAYVDERELNEGVGTETRGGGAKLFSQWCRLMNQAVPVQKTIVLGITHLISNTSGMGAQYTERAARMWLYQKDYDLRTLMKSAWKAGEKQVGFDIKWVCNTSKSGPPGMTITSHLRFGVGIDRLYELVMMACTVGLIKKAGAWFQLTYLAKPDHVALLADKEAPKFQGAEKVYEALAQRPEWVVALEGEVSKVSAGLAGSGGD